MFEILGIVTAVVLLTYGSVVGSWVFVCGQQGKPMTRSFSIGAGCDAFFGALVCAFLVSGSLPIELTLTMYSIFMVRLAILGVQFFVSLKRLMVSPAGFWWLRAYDGFIRLGLLISVSSAVYADTSGRTIAVAFQLSGLLLPVLLIMGAQLVMQWQEPHKSPK